MELGQNIVYGILSKQRYTFDAYFVNLLNVRAS